MEMGSMTIYLPVLFWQQMRNTLNVKAKSVNII